ncbi:MAG: thioredoxin-dependent thiol peroxidase [Anaerolineae bacterium]|jgi:peroxiredoxin Q/BCP|nr:thioredoxin-dependent thiol peroxidase [Anaerolineae bacterium]
MPNIGQPAPDFELPNQDGKPVKLSDFRGKKVIVFVYPKANTSGCTTQACGFRDQYPKVESTNAVVIGISPDTPKDNLKWKTKENLPYDLLSDTEHQMLEAWGVWGEKSMYGKKYFGVIRSHWVIDEQGIVIDEQLNISPAKSVENALKSLG